ncbi:MAG: OmpH family outer membrane protein [Dialister invisus]|uniref:OmpH family outer membrane protein n=1 Tax=Dialister invisus TaxID=218538 RepID=A0A930B9Y9_9FIRM|nr:OmpH family outer membrane protein [Dialister invisus]
MKLRKIAAMTLLMGMLGTAGASANGVGFVNLNEATRNHPDIQKYDRQVSDIVNKYNPQIQKEVEEAQKIKDRAAQQAFINKEIAPLQAKQQQEVTSAVTPLIQAVGNAAEQVRARRGLTVVISAPDAILAIGPNDKEVTDITAEVIAFLKK